ncbi:MULTISPECIES: GGDEF domain-containing protein [Salinivibrio]|uniref:diguanylate cyclase n=1 Tax=Salinivibrio siamensis TaxID=414286 RepID=A0ABX3K4V3_9GAMM|nr:MULTISPECIES: GGDEF domain-containing protein [Salinivibrio]MPS32118.1 GGDEF domain-containing protein [Salinivibrio sp. VYel7]MPX91958.1 GGDEF domain-containing protein [Salinivibrio sp. VYel1]MPX93512.1 GGDEF domain-containing protein [Salinivibrio sp. VYel9]MPX96344.1 GGDEF domain-containing protein [Salinivibrio sp. VYel6]MPY00005.1 GGDEF domain-containing protein [Salinivibrio sp. VYel4]
MNASHIKQYTNSDRAPRIVPLGADQRLLLLQKLQGHLDIKVLFEVYARELEKQIDIGRIIWEHDDISNIIRRGAQHTFRQTFSIKFNKQPLGVLQYSTPYKLDPDEISLLHTYHKLLAGPLNNAVEYTRVKNMALLDGLTGLHNRTSFEQDLQHAVAVCERENIGLVMVMFDMDNFKQVNDTYGHLDGDKVLRRFSLLVKEAVRGSDRCYRLGGDEFAVILQPASKSSVKHVTSRVKSLVSQDHLLSSHQISASVGFSVYRQGDNNLSLYERADQSMYRQKRAR